MMLVLILLGLMLAVACITYRIAFHVSPRQRGKGIPLPGGEQYAAVKHITRPLMDEMRALPYEKISIRAHDGLLLTGRYYHISDDAPLQIQFHGYRGSPERDFCGGHKLARTMNHNTILVDQRAHGESAGRTISFGVNERLDCLAWIEYAISKRTKTDSFQKIPDIFLSGVSMGAATVIMAAGLDLPEQVRGVIADCPYSSPEKIIAKVCRDMRIPPALAMPFIRLGARIFGRFDLRGADAAEAASHAKAPILILHGEDDRFVPCCMSAEIQRANPAMVRRHTFPGAGHGLSYVLDGARYERLVKEFIEDCLRR